MSELRRQPLAPPGLLISLLPIAILTDLLEKMRMRWNKKQMIEEESLLYKIGRSAYIVLPIEDCQYS